MFCVKLFLLYIVFEIQLYSWVKLQFIHFHFSIEFYLMSITLLFIYSSIYEHLDSGTPKFQFDATMNDAVSTLLQLSPGAHVHTFLLKRTAGPRVRRCSTFLDNSKLSSKMFAPIYTLNSTLSGFLLLYILDCN